MATVSTVATLATVVTVVTAVTVAKGVTVAEGGSTTARRFASTARALGDATMTRLAATHIVVVGIGGVGSWAAEGLARSGCTWLTLVDLDQIAESNINRQVHALESTLGAAKVEVMARRIVDIAPEARIATVDDFIDADNAGRLVPADAAVIVDACDQVRAKAALAALARDRGLAIVTCGSAGGRRDPLALRWHDLGEVTEDRLLASLRARLRRDHGFQGRHFGIEAIHAPPSREASTGAVIDRGGAAPGAPLACAGYGSLVSVTATMGLATAQRVIDRIATGVVASR